MGLRQSFAASRGRFPLAQTAVKAGEAGARGIIMAGRGKSNGTKSTRQPKLSSFTTQGSRGFQGVPAISRPARIADGRSVQSHRPSVTGRNPSDFLPQKGTKISVAPNGISRAPIGAMELPAATPSPLCLFVGKIRRFEKAARRPLIPAQRCLRRPSRGPRAPGERIP